jgi:hypothetical protein
VAQGEGADLIRLLRERAAIPLLPRLAMVRAGLTSRVILPRPYTSSLADAEIRARIRDHVGTSPPAVEELQRDFLRESASNEEWRIATLDTVRFAFQTGGHVTRENLEGYIAALCRIAERGTLSGHPPRIAAGHDDALGWPVHLPQGGLKTWLDWQFGKYELFVLPRPLRGGDRDEELPRAEDLGATGQGVAVFLNPFPIVPRIEGEHVVIGLDTMLLSLSDDEPDKALQSIVADRLDLETVLPWANEPVEKRLAHLARFLSCDLREVSERLELGRYSELQARMIERSRLVLRWSRQNRPTGVRHWLGAGEPEAALTQHCLAWVSGYRLSDAYELLRTHAGPGPRERIDLDDILFTESAFGPLANRFHLVLGGDQAPVIAGVKGDALNGPSTIRRLLLRSSGFWAEREAVNEDLAACGLSQPNARRVTDWLLSESFLTEDVDDGKRIVADFAHPMIALAFLSAEQQLSDAGLLWRSKRVP